MVPAPSGTGVALAIDRSSWSQSAACSQREDTAMKHAARSSILRIAVTIAVAGWSPAFAQTLYEFQLTAGMQPTDIDVDSNTGDVYFLDPPSQTINRLSGGVVRQWLTGPCFVTPIDKIAVSNIIFNPAVYFTSIATGSICVLNPASAIVQWYSLPFIVNSPRTLSVDPAGNAWFSSTPASGTPALGSLNPFNGIVQLWLLPAVIASPGDTIDGLQYANNQVYFSVTGSLNQICDMVNPTINPSPTNCYPVPFNQPVPIRVNTSNQVYRIAGSGFNRIVRLDVPSSVLTQWATPSAPDIYLSPVDPPYFTSFSLDADRLDPIIPGVDSPLAPIPVNVFSDYLFAQINAANVPWGEFVPTVENSPLNATVSGAFRTWASTSSSGPLTVDPLGAVWISETAVGTIATFQP
jgi:streptogramin lyase